MVNRGMMDSLSFVPPSSIYNVSRWIHLVKYLVYFFYVSQLLGEPHDASTIAVHGRTKVLWTGSNDPIDASTASSGVFMLGSLRAGVTPFIVEQFIVFSGSSVSVIVSWHKCLQK